MFPFSSRLFSPIYNTVSLTIIHNLLIRGLLRLSNSSTQCTNTYLHISLCAKPFPTALTIFNGIYMFQINVAPQPLDMVHCLPLLLFTSFLRNYYAGRGRLAPPDPCTHQLSGCRCNYLLNSAQLDFRTAQTYRTSAFGSNERKQHVTQQPHRQDIRFQVADKTPLTYRTTHPPTDQTMHLPTAPPTMLQQQQQQQQKQHQQH